MVDSNGANNVAIPPHELLRQLWEEYRYRHDLIWKTVFNLTYSVVVVSAVPYISVKVVNVIKWWILLLPFVAVILGIFGLLRLEREIDKSDDVRNKYLVLRNHALNALKGEIKYPEPDPTSRFRHHIRMYVSGLVLFALLNAGPLLKLCCTASGAP